jgi:hypothetical protein
MYDGVKAMIDAERKLGGGAPAAAAPVAAAPVATAAASSEPL